MLPFIGRPGRPTALAVIEHGVVATRKRKHSSGSFYVKGYVSFLRGLDAMVQNRQLAGHSLS
jgi:hypothetical protein